MAYVGSAPARRPDAEIAGRRPVIAILDTGCGSHPWLDDVVDTSVTLDGHPIGFDPSVPESEVHPDLVGPLDGMIDARAGHGTFIAGLVHQACPDADILAWRIMPPQGPISEYDWITALAQVAELVRRHRAGEPGGHAIDVLTMSIGYYHETPEDELFDPMLHEILADLSHNGTLVVCSAGNDATSRPAFPAAFAPWSDGQGPVPADPDVPPIVSVGALNPNGTTDAMFSNAGPWVRAYAPGAALFSTIPPNFQGGLQARSAREVFGRPRATMDPDDYTSGFAVWSGTSFAAPVLAGRLAAELLEDPDPTTTRAEAAAARAWRAVEKVAGIERPEG